MKNSKKGFTLVELIIVVAVIALLAAVLIPTFSSLISKANQAKDEALVSNLNKAIALSTEKYDTVYDVLGAVKENAGFDVAKISASVSEHEILWDSVNYCFVYKTTGGVKYIPETQSTPIADDEQYKFWQICDEKHPIPETQTYSIYWAGNDIDKEIKVSVGFDAGNANTANVVYEHTGKEQEVVINTNSGIVTINAANDIVNRHGYCALLDVEAVKATSLHEYGTSEMVSVKSGRVVFENVESANTIVFVEANSAILAVANEVEMPEVKRASEVTSFEMQTVASNGTVATKTTVKVENDTITVETKDNAGNTVSTPASVKADEVKESVKATTTKDSIKDAKVPVTIKTFEELKTYASSQVVNGIVGANITVSEIMTVTSNKVIDLNGYKLTATLTDGRVFHLENGCEEFTVNATKDGGEMTMDVNATKCYGFIKVSNKLSLTLNGGRYTGVGYNGAFVRMDANKNGNGSVINFNDCYMETSGKSYGFINSFNESVKEFNVIGGTYIFGGAIEKCGPFEIACEKALFDGVTVVAAQGPVIEGRGDVVVKNCTFGKPVGGQSWSAAAIATAFGSNVTVNGGEYEGQYAVYTYSSGGTITVNGGSFKGTEAVLKADCGDKNQSKEAIITINGGEFDGKIVSNGKESGFAAYIYINGGSFANTAFACTNNNSHIVITGGTFSIDPSAYLAEGYKATQKDDVWIVSK